MIDSSLPRTYEEAQQALAQARREYASHAWDTDAGKYRRVVEEMTNVVEGMRPISDFVFEFEVSLVEQPKPEAKEHDCIAVYGPGPVEKRCRDCIHLHTMDFWSGRKAYKCDLRKLTHGRKTDHSPKWPTCGRFVEGQGPVHSIDPR